MFTSKNICLILFGINAVLGSLEEAAYAFPITVQSCGQDVKIAAAPQRAITIDINQTEVMLKLGLADRMLAVAGLANKNDVLPELQKELSKLKEISSRYPSFEALVSLEPDFIFAGWQYGFSETTGITPRRLAQLGVASYAITESCARIMERSVVSLEDSFQDILNIGEIFGKSDEAKAMVRGFREQLLQISKDHKTRPRVFLYDSGEQSPFTAGGLAIPNAMIELAGGDNIFSDVRNTWTNVNWEDVITRRPEFIIIVDYDQPSASDKWRFLQRRLANFDIPAIKNENYLIVPYAAATPGVRNTDATISIATALDKLRAKAQDAL